MLEQSENLCLWSFKVTNVFLALGILQIDKTTIIVHSIDKTNFDLNPISLISLLLLRRMGLSRSSSI